MNIFEEFVSSLENVNLTDNVSLSFKFNILELTPVQILFNLNLLVSYVITYSHGNTVWYSCGRHDEGVAGNPHIHLHMVIEHYIKSNESRRRVDFGIKIPSLSCKISRLSLVEDLEKHMTYPHKEGKSLVLTHPGMLCKVISFPEEVLLYLRASGKSLYDVKKANDLKKQRASARQ